MRRLLLPAVLLAIAIIAAGLAGRANDDANRSDTADGESGASLGTPLVNARRAPEWLRQPATDRQLEANARAALGVVGDRGVACLSLHRDGTPIAEIERAAPMIPGELQRLLIIAALDTLAGGGFVTEVVRVDDVLITDGLLEGDLWFIGGADPTLSTAAFIDRFDDDRAATSLEELAALVVEELEADGITSIGGSVIGVASKYADSPQQFDGADWTAADLASNEVGLTGGLLVNNGFQTFPAEIDNPANVRAPNAAIHAAGELARLLGEAGIEVLGPAANGLAPEAGTRVSVAMVDSPSLAAIAARAIHDGTTAEMLFRETADRTGLPAGVIPAFGILPELVDVGYIAEDEAGAVRPFDGSGLSHNDTITCGVLTKALDAGEGSLLVDALLPGDSIDCAPSGLTELRMHATASAEVTGLAGRALVANGDEITFTAIANWLPDPETGELPPRGLCDDLIPAVLDVIADHPAGPTLDDLAPLAPVTAP